MFSMSSVKSVIFVDRQDQIEAKDGPHWSDVHQDFGHLVSACFYFMPGQTISKYQMVSFLIRKLCKLFNQLIHLLTMYFSSLYS